MKNITGKVSLKWSVIASAFALPLLAVAQGSSVETVCANLTSLTIFGVFRCIFGLIGYLIALLFILATLFFLWGVVKYIMNYENEGKRQERREFMMWGVIALFVMASVWGLVGILENTFGLGSGGTNVGTSPGVSSGNQLPQPPPASSGGGSGSGSVINTDLFPSFNEP